MKKMWLGYGLFIAAIWIYFSFYYPLQTYSNSHYAAYRHALFFSQLPLEWILLITLFKWRKTSKSLEKWQVKFKKDFKRSLIFASFLTLSYTLVSLPFSLVGYWLALREKLSNQPFSDWIYEWAIGLLFLWIAILFIVYVGIKLIKKFKKNWWLVLWLILLPISVFLIYVQPIWIDPLFEDFKPLPNSELKTEILEVADEAGIPKSNVYEVNMSEKTSTYNAYVTGIGDKARIVLWDTTLQGMSKDEILFILAHEIGHYVKKHVYYGVGGYIVLSLFMLFLTAKLFETIFPRLTRKTTIHERTDLRALLIPLLIFSVLSFLTQPISQATSRMMEHSADEFAVEHTDNLQPALDSYYKLAVKSKSDVDPLPWVKWFRYSHPPLEKRIQMISDEIAKRENTQ